jgi:hypothetical protein
MLPHLILVTARCRNARALERLIRNGWEIGELQKHWTTSVSPGIRFRRWTGGAYQESGLEFGYSGKGPN